MSWFVGYALAGGVCLLIMLPFAAYQWTTGGRWSRAVLADWAIANEYTLYKIDRERAPENLVDLRQFSHAEHRSACFFYLIEAVDIQHIRRSGLVRVTPPLSTDGGHLVELIWLSARQLDWRDQPPRGIPSPRSGAQGWYVDPTGRHELRWYSAGTPTDLVIDGAAEGRDPPADAE